MTNLLSSHLEDCSTPQYFCFSIRCEVCGEYWYSSSIPFSKAVRFLFPKRPRCPSTEKNKSSMRSFTKGRRNEPSRPREKKPESGSVNVPSADDWSAILAFSSVMKWICAGSAPGA